MEKLSFVIPCYGSEATIARVVAEIRATMATRSFLDYEVLLVNDASPDQVWEQIELLTQEDFRVKGVNLAKNFGQHSALMAGYAQASVTMWFLWTTMAKPQPQRFLNFWISSKKVTMWFMGIILTLKSIGLDD